MAAETGKGVLTYFKGRGRAELIRLMLEVAGIPYRERTITKELFDQLREGGELFFKQLPLLELDGMKMVQSAATVRYIARRHDMYGSSAVEAYQCDMLADGLADLRERFIMFSDYEQRRQDPETYNPRVRDKLIPRYMSAMERQLQTNNNEKEEGAPRCLVGGKLSYADVALLEVLELIEDSYPGILATSTYPHVARFHQQMREMERVRDYLDSDRRHPPLNDEYIAHVREILPR